MASRPFVSLKVNTKIQLPRRLRLMTYSSVNCTGFGAVPKNAMIINKMSSNQSRQVLII